MPKPLATLADCGEIDFLAWVRRAARGGRRADNQKIPVSIGDDAAVLRLAGREAVVTTDALIENVHFKFDWTSERDLGAKALAANLSDLAAMAARPVAAFLSLGVPPTTSLGALKDFFLGLIAEGRKYDCPLVGGDLVRARDWTINLTLIGSPIVAGRPALRSAARPGQRLYITGWPGESAAGLEALRRGDRQPALLRRHLRPTPRLEEAAALIRACGDLAMLDVSDGVMNDARQMARESGAAIEIEAGKLPISRGLQKYAEDLNRKERKERNWILFGGEDYELLFASSQPTERIRAAFKAAKISTPIAEIGKIVKGSGVRIFDASGAPIEMKHRTFKHF